MRLFFGIVMSLDDPLKMNRVKVKIFNLHSLDEGKIPTDKLFYSTVMMPNTGASTLGVGQNHGLLKNSHVICTFLDPYYQQCVVLGTFFGTNDMPTPALANYPNNKVTVSESGQSLQFNNETLEVTLSNGNGNNLLLNDSVNLKSIADINLDSDSNTSINVGNNLSVGSGASSTIYANGDLNLGAGGSVIISAPRIELNPNFSFADPSLTDLQTVTIKKRKAVNYINPPTFTAISQKDDIVVDKIEPGNVCTLKTPLNLYDTAFSTIDTEWNEKSINVLFEEIGFDNNTYDGNVYWGTVWLGAVLKRAGYKYLKTAEAFDYLIYENSSDVKKELTKEEMIKGDIIIFTRGDSFFTAIYEGTYNAEYNYYTCIMGDSNDGVFVTDIFVDDETQMKRIIRAKGCADNKVFYNGKCDLPVIKTGYMINDDLISMALTIYHEARSEPIEGQIAVGHVIKNRLFLVETYGLVNGYRTFVQKFRQPSQLNPFTVSGICFANMQFSYANAVDKGGIFDWTPKTEKSWCLALEIAEKVINGELSDPTNIKNLECGAVFYFAQNTITPYWYPTLIKWGYKPYVIGNHTFMVQPNNKPLA